MAKLDLTPLSEEERERLSLMLKSILEEAIRRKVKHKVQRQLRRSHRRPKRARAGNPPNVTALEAQAKRELGLEGMPLTFDTAQAICSALGMSGPQRLEIMSPFRKLLAQMVEPDVAEQIAAFNRDAYVARTWTKARNAILDPQSPAVTECKTSADVERLISAAEKDGPNVEALYARFTGRPRLSIRADVWKFLKKNPRIKAAYALLYRVSAQDFARGDAVGQATANLVKKLRKRLQIKFEEDDLPSLVLQNPTVAALLEAERRMREGILEHIPTEPPDAYPLARSLHRHFVLHVGPTNSGKTHEAMSCLADVPSGAYLGPLRLLAFEQCEDLRGRGVACSLITGEEQDLVEDATHVASTIELADLRHEIDLAVIDEAQMLADEARGHRWTETLLGIPAHTVHVCMAPQALSLVQELVAACHDTSEVVQHERLVPLLPQLSPYRLPQDLCEGDALVVFSRNEVHRVANLVTAAGHEASLVYGALPHTVRHAEAVRFASHDTEVVVATDAIGMGMNLPIKRVVFLQMSKYDGRSVRTLLPEEVRQIAGRAGRYGIYDEGVYATTEDPARLHELYESPVPNLTCARLGFTARLLSVPGRVSELLDHWTQLKVPTPFVQNDMAATVSCVGILEKTCERLGFSPDDATVKELVYTFATMAFDIDDRTQQQLWRRMFEAALREEVVKLDLPDSLPSSVRALEKQSALCDLKYQYYRLFGNLDDLARIQACREQIDKLIRHALTHAEQCG